MIRPLRRRHRLLITIVFIVSIVAAMLAWTARSPAPVMDALPPALR